MMRSTFVVFVVLVGAHQANGQTVTLTKATGGVLSIAMEGTIDFANKPFIASFLEFSVPGTGAWKTNGDSAAFKLGGPVPYPWSGTITKLQAMTAYDVRARFVLFVNGKQQDFTSNVIKATTK